MAYGSDRIRRKAQNRPGSRVSLSGAIGPAEEGDKQGVIITHTGDLAFDAEVKVKRIEILIVQGDLKVCSNNSLEGVVGIMKIGGDMVFEGAPALQSLPKEVLVGGSVTISECAVLGTIGVMRAGGDVAITRCPKLETIEDGLEVGGKLVIGACGSLKQLPRGMKVTGDVFLDAHAASLGIPPDAVIGGAIIRFNTP